MRRLNRLRRWLALRVASVAARLHPASGAGAADSASDAKAVAPLDRGRAGLTWNKPRRGRVTEGGSWGVFAWEDPDLKD